MTRIHVCLCVLLLTGIHADFLGLPNAFDVALASFEERSYVDGGERRVRDAKSTDPPDASVSTSKAAAADSGEAKLTKGEGSSTPLAGEMGLEEADDSSLQVNFMKRGQDNETIPASSSEAATSSHSASVKTTSAVTEEIEDLMKKREASHVMGSIYISVNNSKDSHMSRPQSMQPQVSKERTGRNTFIEEYRQHLTDRFHEIVDRDTNSRPSSSTPTVARKHQCTKQQKVEGELTGEGVSSTGAEGLEEKVVGEESGDASDLGGEDTAPLVADRVKRERQGLSASTRYDDSEDEEMLLEEEEAEQRRATAKKRYSARRWGRWGKWSPCSVSCGVGRLTRWRHCQGEFCAPGEKEAQIKSCTQPSC